MAAKNPWDPPTRDNSAWSQPKKKPDPKPAEFRKPTYERESAFGKKERYEGSRDAGRESKKDKWR